MLGRSITRQCCSKLLRHAIVRLHKNFSMKLHFELMHRTQQVIAALTCIFYLLFIVDDKRVCVWQLECAVLSSSIVCTVASTCTFSNHSVTRHPHGQIHNKIGIFYSLRYTFSVLYKSVGKKHSMAAVWASIGVAIFGIFAAKNSHSNAKRIHGHYRTSATVSNGSHRSTQPMLRKTVVFQHPM